MVISRQLKKTTAAVVAIAILAASSVALAHFGSNQTITATQPSPKTSQKTAKIEPAAPATQSPATAQTTNGPCTTTTTSDVDNTPPDTHNNTTTTTECHSSTGSSNSIDVTNNSSQSTSTGSVSYQNNSTQ